MAEQKREQGGFFAGAHPVSAFVYLLLLIGITMFVTDPVLLACSMSGGALFCAALQSRKERLSDLLFYLPLFVLIALTNPLFSHNGVTPLFFLNGNPVTLEAILYGADIAAMLVAVMLWCKGFSRIMTSDKLLFLFGRANPRVSLVLSMSLRFLPLFRQKHREIREAQEAMGYRSQRGIVNRAMCAARIFSALVTWALENAVETGASMKARGYGLRGRSYFFLFRFRRRDAILLSAGVILAGAVLACLSGGYASFRFYPRLSGMSWTMPDFVCRGGFALLCWIPFLTECGEVLHWRYLRSKI